jgi:DNA-binding XRE family transcriptional regulator
VTGCPAVRIAVCYDGVWFHHAARYFAWERGTQISLAGLHDVIRWHAARLFGCPVGQVAITAAHYIAGQGTSPPGWDQELADQAITGHEVPVTVAKGEVGADVELALTCYQIACETSPDLIALLAGDGDFAPLAARLAGRGVRILVPRANLSYPAAAGTVTVATSAWLTRRATDTPALADLLDTALAQDYPPHLARPFTPTPAASPGSARRHGTVTCWNPGSWYGFLTSGNLTWYASIRDTPRHEPLSPGTSVTFTGHPAPPPGKTYPAARTILPHPGTPPTATADPPETAPPARGGGAAPDTGRPWLTAFDSTALTTLRQARGLSKVQLSHHSGVSLTTIIRLERGPDPACLARTASRLAAALGQPPAALTRPPAAAANANGLPHAPQCGERGMPAPASEPECP